MKHLAIAIILISSLSVFAKEAAQNYGPVGNYFERTFKVGSYKGNNCRVKISKPMNDITHASHRIEVQSLDRVLSARYQVNESSVLGGRGDCANVIKNTVDTIIIKNSPQVPCGSHPDRSNKSGIKIQFLGANVHFTIYDSLDREVAFCTTERSVLNF